MQPILILAVTIVGVGVLLSPFYFLRKEDVDVGKKRNILGYTPKTMDSAKPRSYYFTYVGFVFMVILGINGQPLTPTSVDWWVTVGAEIIGFLMLSAIFAKFIGWLAYSFRRLLGMEVNKFDYFADAYLTLSIIGLIPVLFG